jgi:hypothetical protein
MKLDRDPELDEFRAEVRDLLQTHRPAVHMTATAEVRAPEVGDVPALRAWTARLFDAG